MKRAADVVGRPLSADGELLRAYTERTPGSAASFAAAGRVLPGGETRAVTTYPLYPLVIAEGHGARLTDVDGHSYLDLVNNYTAMVHGSAFAPVTEAVVAGKAAAIRGPLSGRHRTKVGSPRARTPSASGA